MNNLGSLCILYLCQAARTLINLIKTKGMSREELECKYSIPQLLWEKQNVKTGGGKDSSTTNYNRTKLGSWLGSQQSLLPTQSLS